MVKLVIGAGVGVCVRVDVGVKVGVGGVLVGGWWWGAGGGGARGGGGGGGGCCNKSRPGQDCLLSHADYLQATLRYWSKTESYRKPVEYEEQNVNISKNIFKKYSLFWLILIPSFFA